MDHPETPKVCLKCFSYPCKCRRTTTATERHQWDKTGERCVKCGGKDWLGGPCVPKSTPTKSGEEGETVEFPWQEHYSMIEYIRDHVHAYIDSDEIETLLSFQQWADLCETQWPTTPPQQSEGEGVGTKGFTNSSLLTVRCADCEQSHPFRIVDDFTLEFIPACNCVRHTESSTPTPKDGEGRYVARKAWGQWWVEVDAENRMIAMCTQKAEADKIAAALNAGNAELTGSKQPEKGTA